jgi:hypothetical protein
MKLIKYLKRIFRNNKNQYNLYAEAIAKGIKDTVEELGYSMGLDDQP